MNEGVRDGRPVLAVTVATTLALALVTFYAGFPALAASVEPIEISGNHACGALAAQYSGGQTWTEFKIDSRPSDGVFGDGTLSVTVSNSDAHEFDWSSNIGLDAIFVKAGDGGFLYLYDPPGPEATADTNLTGSAKHAISHISYCYDLPDEIQPGKIIVVKEVTEGSDVSEVFTFTESGFTLDDNTLAHGEMGMSGDVEPGGDYSVSESVPAGWTLQSATCDDANSTPADINVEQSETVTCTFVNDEIPDEVSPTSIVSTTTTIVSTTTTIVSTTDTGVSPETLPFTGFESGATGLLALVLVASGALALVGTRVFRGETDE